MVFRFVMKREAVFIVSKKLCVQRIKSIVFKDGYQISSSQSVGDYFGCEFLLGQGRL